MAVLSQFYKHSNLGTPMEAFTLQSGWRYQWLVFGSTLSDEISSLRATAYGGNGGNVYGFTENHFLGNYASLNMRDGWTSWWSYVGGALNDDIESAIIVNRNNSGETPIEVGTLVKQDFITKMDQAVAGTAVSRKGDPRIYSLFWPGHDPSKIFISIEQDLNVAVDWWPDYDAQVRYDIYPYLSSTGRISAYVAWVYVWVEGGIFSGRIYDRLQPKLVAGASALNDAIRAKLGLLADIRFRDVYLLPGPPPTSNFGDISNAKNGSTLVLVR